MGGGKKRKKIGPSKCDSQRDPIESLPTSKKRFTHEESHFPLCSGTSVCKRLGE